MEQADESGGSMRILPTRPLGSECLGRPLGEPRLTMQVVSMFRMGNKAHGIVQATKLLHPRLPSCLPGPCLPDAEATTLAETSPQT